MKKWSHEFQAIEEKRQIWGEDLTSIVSGGMENSSKRGKQRKRRKTFRKRVCLGPEHASSAGRGTMSKGSPRALVTGLAGKNQEGEMEEERGLL